MMKLWMVTFDNADLEDCNGVYSTKEKAFNAVDKHFERMEDDGKYTCSWDNRDIEYEDEECKIESFDLVEHGFPYGTKNKVIKCSIMIQMEYLDDEVE